MTLRLSKSAEELDKRRKTWQWKDYFNESRDYLRYNYGLDLTLIELVHLKNIVQRCFAEQKEIEKGDPREYWGFDIEIESGVRFLNDYYGVSYEVLTSQIFFLRQTDIEYYFKRQQEIAHMP